MPAPALTLPDSRGKTTSLKDLRGGWVVLYFYPKDNTPGCTAEALDFSSEKDAFRKMGAEIIGVSPDSLESHARFEEKHGLSILLLSDQERAALGGYGVWRKKKLYGREFMGVVRSTFIIDPKGVIRRVWSGVKVKGHAAEVKKALEELQKGIGE